MGIKSWRKGGTHDFAKWQVSDQVADISELKVGDILFADCNQFDALNLCRVNAKGSIANNVYASFIDPYDSSRGRQGLSLGPESDFCIWDFEIQRSSFGNKFFKAVREVEIKDSQSN